jgi:hypothetical protein
MERRAKAMAEREGREYVPVTERGAVVHAARQARAAFREMRERVELARETYGTAREEGQGRVSAGLAALRAATSKERGPRSSDDIRERLAQITGRDGPDRDVPERGVQGDEEPKRSAQERLREALDKDQGVERDAGAEDGEKPSIRQRLDDVLNKPREKLEIEDEPQKDREVESEKEIDRDADRDRGLSH